MTRYDPDKEKLEVLVSCPTAHNWAQRISARMRGLGFISLSDLVHLESLHMRLNCIPGSITMFSFTTKSGLSNVVLHINKKGLKMYDKSNECK